MTHILCCMLRLYFLNIFSTNHSQKENPTRMLLFSQHFFSIVEHLLRVYVVCFQHGYILIQQFNKKRMMLQGVKLLPCDCIEPSNSLNRLITALPIVIKLVGRIGKSVGCRSKFPTLLQHFPYLVPLHLYL